MARVVLHLGELDRIDTAPMLAEIAEDVASDARRIVPVDEADLKGTIRVEGPDGDVVRVVAGGQPGPVTDKPVDYPVYVEMGTRYMAAQPYLRPALYRVRS